MLTSVLLQSARLGRAHTATKGPNLYLKEQNGENTEQTADKCTTRACCVIWLL